MTHRTIKFRCWNTNEKKWVNDFVIYPDGVPVWIDYHGSADYELENVILMQFTNLTDKNGKEIYEGDIIKTEAEPYRYKQVIEKVYWDETEAGFRVDSFRFGNQMYLSRTEVIGNIYENPDLLES